MPYPLDSLPCLHIFPVFVPSLGFTRYTFPSQGARSDWLIAHIAALLAASAALCFSLLASILYLAQERHIKRKRKAGDDSWWAPLDWLPPLDTIDRIAHTSLLFGFPCMTIGLVIGAVLVQETPLGAAYFLDPESDCLLCHVVRLCTAPLSQAPHWVARTQGRLSLRGRTGRNARRMGCQPPQPRA